MKHCDFLAHSSIYITEKIILVRLWNIRYKEFDHFIEDMNKL